MPRKTNGAAEEQRRQHRASMRPRPDAAENADGRHLVGAAVAGFNEAAARCRGKRPLLPPCAAIAAGFNEAAARCRGKLR